MKSEKENIDLIIARNLAGEATDAEINRLNDWLNASEANYAEYKVIQDCAEHTFEDDKMLITDDAFKNVMKQWDGEEEIEQKKYRFSIVKTLLVSAASIVLILVSVFTYRQMLFAPQSVADINQPVLIEKFSPEGQKTQVFLPDGSFVMLNSGSRLQYTSNYNNKYRTVSLTGEAYFEVKEDKTKPFQIKTGNVAVSTLGSSFNINSFYEDGTIEVVLTGGVALIENLFSSLKPGMPLRTVMRPGQKILYSLEDTSCEVFAIENTYDYTCWKDGIISFRQADFITLINTLERWYGVKFSWDEIPKGNWAFSGEFNNEYLDKVLQALSNKDEFSFEKNAEGVKLIYNKNTDLKNTP